MPELPEVKAHAERLSGEYAGRVLEGFRPLSFTALKTATPPPDAAFGSPLRELRSRGKLLVLDFGELGFTVHLMQGGRLKPDPKASARPRGGLARWSFDVGDPLLLTEAGREHKAGVWTVEGRPEEHEPLDHLGPDADSVSLTDLTPIVESTSKRLHGFLRDQRQLAGLGRRLANEICHTARLSPFATTNRLDSEQLERLQGAIRECIDESLAYERSRADMSSSKERPGAVHHRSGDQCPVCDDVVRAVEYSAYTVNYCATCQTDGKVLADNTTSRFLK